MTFSHDDANARLLDLVYGEGTAEERAAVEAHVATCAACTAELASLGDTRARLRTALEDAPVPARAHARILEAATQAAAPLAAAAGAAPIAAAAAAAPIAARARAAAQAGASGPSFWEKLRAKWTLPTFATVGAVAIVVIASKVFLEPDKTAERGRDFLNPPAATAPAAAPLENEALNKVAEQPAPPAAEPAPPPRRFENSNSAFKDIHGGRPGMLGGGTLAQRLAHRKRSGSEAGLDDLAGASSGGGLGRGIGAAPAAPLPPREANDKLLEGALAKKPAPAAAPGRRAKEARADEEEEGGLAHSEAARRDYAPPPSGWKGGAPAGAPAATAAAPAPRPAKKSLADGPLDSLDGFGGSVPSASAEADERVGGKAQAQSAGKKKAEAKAEPYAAAAPAAAAPAPKPAPVAVASNAPSKSQPAQGQSQLKDAEKSRVVQKQAKADDADSEEALTRRADQLFAQRRWSEAIAAYRELLRRYPRDDAEPRWRTRLKEAQAQAEVQQNEAQAQRAAKAAAPATKKAKASSQELLEAAPAKE
jgi:anti-sigma factor RsiW